MIRVNKGVSTHKGIGIYLNYMNVSVMRGSRIFPGGGGGGGGNARPGWASGPGQGVAASDQGLLTIAKPIS